MRIVHKGQILLDAQHVVVIVARQLQRVAMAAPEAERHLGGKTNPDPRQHAEGDNPADGGEERNVLRRPLAELLDEQPRGRQLIAGIQQHGGEAGERD